MEQIAIEAELRKDNPTLSGIVLSMYAAALKLHCEASENVSRNGAICSHPRTGMPIENPYLKVQSHAVTIFSKFMKVNSDRVLRLLQQSPPSS